MSEKNNTAMRRPLSLLFRAITKSLYSGLVRKIGGWTGKCWLNPACGCVPYQAGHIAAACKRAAGKGLKRTEL